MPASTNTKASRERRPFPPSCPYTPTAVLLYPNNFAPIPNLKRIFFLFIRLSSLSPAPSKTASKCIFCQN